MKIRRAMSKKGEAQLEFPVIAVRVTHEQRDYLRSLEEATGLTTSEILRELIASAVARPITRMQVFLAERNEAPRP